MPIARAAGPLPFDRHDPRAVHKAAAFGVADARLGEKVCVAVICREGEHVSGRVLRRELQEWVRIGRIAPQPVRWSESVNGH